MASFLADVGELASRRGRLVIGRGQAGDGNVHLALFEPGRRPAGR